jgi:multidrug resistance efflux pump
MKPNHRSLRLFGLIGLALLAVSTAGAIFALHPPGVGNNRASSAPEGGGHVGTVVCYGNVDVESGVTALYPLQAGRVTEVKVKDNDVVKKGAVLLQLDDRLARYRRQQAEGDYKVAQAELAKAQQLPQQFQAKADQQQEAVKAIKSKLAAAGQLLMRTRQMLKDKLVTAEQLGAAEEDYKALEASVRAEEAKLRELQLTDPQKELARAEGQEAAKKAQLDQAQYAVEECALVAPTDGMVLQVLVGPGSILPANPAQPAIMFAPAGPRIIRAEVEQEFAGRLAAGQAVIVHDEHGAGPQRAGKITRISDWYTRSRTPDPSRVFSNDVRTLECIITLDPGQPSFRLGQRVRVTAGPSAGAP